MSIRVNVVCFDLPAALAVGVAKRAGGEVLDNDPARPVVIGVDVCARKPQVATRKAVEAVQAALADLPGPQSVLPIIPEEEEG